MAAEQYEQYEQYESAMPCFTTNIKLAIVGDWVRVIDSSCDFVLLWYVGLRLCMDDFDDEPEDELANGQADCCDPSPVPSVGVQAMAFSSIFTDIQGVPRVWLPGTTPRDQDEPENKEVSKVAV